MKQEEKQLLLVDLCARLPYGVKFLRESWNYEWDQELSVVEVLEDIDNEGYINHTRVYKAWDIKPCLRPMSSMTEEESNKLADIYEKMKNEYLIGLDVDFLNAHHFDFRDLIDKGLALEAPEGMYKTE